MDLKSGDEENIDSQVTPWFLDTANELGAVTKRLEEARKTRLTGICEGER